MKHLIQQLSLEPRTRTRELGERLAHQLPDLINDEVLPKLGEFFDQIAPKQSLRIDRLECDLGTISLQNLKSQLPQLLIEALETHFKKIVVPLSRGIAGPDRVHLSLPSQTPSAKLTEEGRITRSSEASQLEIFLHVLRHGRFPWWFPESDWPALSHLETWKPATLESLRISLIQSIEDGDGTLIHRFIHHISPRTAEFLCANLPKPGSLQAGRLAAADSLSNTDKRCLFTLIWLSSSSPDPVRLAQIFQHSSFQNLSRHAGEIARNFVSLGNDDHPIRRFRRSSRRSNEAQRSDLKSTETRHSHSVGKKSIDQVPPQTNEEHALTVSNAGLILLYPFLTPLFRKFDWLDSKDQFLPEQRWRAVQALQYLCRGETGLAEPTLVLEKVLCGIPLEALADFPRLSSEVRDECDALLKAAITHWSVLKNTSPDGLRSGFLLRPGLLFQQDEQWQIRVEKQSIDVLLNHLPWPISIIKLPWLDLPFHVQWST